MRGFFVFLVVGVVCLLSCVTKTYKLESYNGVFSDEQLESIYIKEKLPPLDGWIKVNMIDYETKDTIMCRAFYKNLKKNSEYHDSILGMKYIYKRIDTTNYFTKQIIIDKNKTN